MVVDFLILGAHRSGGRLITDGLKTHPWVSTFKSDDPFLFNKAQQWRSPREGGHPGRLMGMRLEAITQFPVGSLEHMTFVENIYSFNPAIKLIYVVRNPFERILSAYKQALRIGEARKSLAEALVHDPVYLDTCRYYAQIKPYLDAFGEERVLILTFDDLFHHPHEMAQRLAGFLGISAEGWSVNTWGFENPSEGYSNYREADIPQEDRGRGRLWPFGKKKKASKVMEDEALKFDPTLMRWVRDELEKDIISLERLTKKDLSQWLRLEFESSKVN